MHHRHVSLRHAGRTTVAALLAVFMLLGAAVDSRQAMAADDTVTPSQLANSVALESHITSAKLLICEYDANSCVDAASVDPLDVAKYQGVKFAFDYALTDADAITKAGYMLSYRLTDPYLIELYGGNIDGPITTAGGSEHIGTFHVDKDGVVVIRLDESYIDNKNPPYRGSVEMFANGDANKVAHEITVRKEDTQTNTPAIVIKPNITPATDISIGKSGQLRKHDGSHTAHYSVTVSSDRGTDGKPIAIADAVQGLTCDQLTLNVERRNRNGQVERSFAQPVDCAVDNDGVAKFSTQLDGFDADGGSYVLTYDLAVPADMVYDTVHNSATASYIDPHGTEQSKTTTHTLTIDTRTLEVHKSAGEPDRAKGTVTWTVTVKDTVPLDGYVLHDVWNGNALAAADMTGGSFTLAFTDEHGHADPVQTIAGTPDGYVFPTSSVPGTYVFTYTTPMNTAVGTQSKNVARVETPVGPPISTETTANDYIDNVDTRQYVAKSAGERRMNDDGAVESLQWKVAVDATEFALPAGWELNDEVYEQERSYYSLDDLRGIVAAFNAEVARIEQHSGATIGPLRYSFAPARWNGPSYASIDEIPDAAVIRAFTVTFPRGIPKGVKLDVAFWSSVEQDAPDTVSNNVRVNNTEIVAKHHLAPGGDPTIAKWDANAASAPANNGNGNAAGNSANNSDNGGSVQTSHAVGEIDAVRWGVQLTIPYDYAGGAMTVTERIPQALHGKLQSVELKQSNSAESAQLRLKDGTVETQRISLGEYGPLDAATDQDGNIVLTLGKDLVETLLKRYQDTLEFTLALACEAPGEQEVNAADQGLVYANMVEARWNDTTISSMQTQTITKESSTPAEEEQSDFGVAKHYVCADGERLDDACKTVNGGQEYELGAGNTLNYRVDVDSHEFTVLPDTSTLHVTDVIRYRPFVHDHAQNMAVQAYSLTLAPDSLRISVRNDDGTYTQQSASDYMVTYDETDSRDVPHPYGDTELTNTLEIMLPNTHSYRIEYAYAVSFMKDANGNIVKPQLGSIVNTAAIEGTHKKDESVVQASVKGTATFAAQTVSIYKVAAANYAKQLAGAEFRLDRWDVDVQGWVTVNAKLASPKEGGLELFEDTNINGVKDDNEGLAANAAYRLVETEAPQGYEKAKEPYEFIMLGDAGADGTQARPDDFQGKVLYAGQRDFFPNVADTTMLRVEKLWYEQDSTGDVEQVANPNGSVTYDIQRYQATYPAGTSMEEYVVERTNCEGNCATTSVETDIVPSGSDVFVSARISRWNAGAVRIYVNGKQAETITSAPDSKDEVTVAATIPVTRATDILVVDGYQKLDGVEVQTRQPVTKECATTRAGVCGPQRDETFREQRTLNAKQGWSAIIANLPLYKTAQSASGESVITYYSYYIQERQYCHANGGCVNADKLRAPKRAQANASYAANGANTGNEASTGESNASGSAPGVSDPSDASDVSDVSNVEGYTNGAGITQGVMYMRNMVATNEEEAVPVLPMTGGVRWATPQHWAALLALAMAVALYRKVQHI